MFEIREARETDIPELIGLAKDMVADSTFASLPFDEGVAQETMRATIRNRSSVAFLAVYNGHTIGVIAGQIGRAMFSQEAVAQDKALYVVPKWRDRADKRTGVADRLLKHFCLWATERGAVRITICNSAGAPDVPFVQKLNQYQFKRAGSVMYLEV